MRFLRLEGFMDNQSIKTVVADRISQFKGCEEELADHLGVNADEVLNWRNGALPDRVPTDSQLQKILHFVPLSDNSITAHAVSNYDEYSLIADNIVGIVKEMEKAGVLSWVERLSSISRELKS